MAGIMRLLPPDLPISCFSGQVGGTRPCPLVEDTATACLVIAIGEILASHHLLAILILGERYLMSLPTKMFIYKMGILISYGCCKD